MRVMMWLHAAVMLFSLVAAGSGAISLRVVAEGCNDQVVSLVLYSVLAAGHATRYSLLACVVSVLVHVAFLLLFASTELTIRLNDSTQQNPQCSPNCIRNNSLLLVDENWRLVRWSLATSCLQIVANAAVLAMGDDEGDAASPKVKAE